MPHRESAAEQRFCILTAARQYQHAGFRKALRSYGIIQSMSRSGNCYDNACAENFFSHFKQEFLRGRSFATVEQFRTELGDWMEWFNSERLSEKRGWLSPRAYRDSLASGRDPREADGDAGNTDR